MRQGTPRGFLLCIKIPQLITVMTKMHLIFLLHLILTVKSDLQEARGSRKEQGPVQGVTAFQKSAASKATSRTCETRR